MTSEEAASDDAASDEAASAASDGSASAASDDAAFDDAASDDAAYDDMTSGPLVFRSTILQEHYFFRSSLTSGALLLSGAYCLQNHLSFIFFCSLFAHSEPINDVTF